MPSLLTVGALSTAANSTSGNILAGKQGEYLARRSLVQIALVGSAAGQYNTVQCGSRTIVQDQYMNPSNRWPIDPDDFNIQFVGMPGEKLYVDVRNSTAGALTTNCVVKITEV